MYAVPQSSDRPGSAVPLAANWNEATDATGDKYYYNVVTQETTWTRPTATDRVKVKHVPAHGKPTNMYAEESTGPIYAPPSGAGPEPMYAVPPEEQAVEEDPDAVYVAPVALNPDYAPSPAPRTAARMGNAVGDSITPASGGPAGQRSYLPPQGQGYGKPQNGPPVPQTAAAAPEEHVYEYSDQLVAGSAALRVKPHACVDEVASAAVHPDPQYDSALGARAVVPGSAL